MRETTSGTREGGRDCDRSAEYEARRCNREFGEYEFAEVHDLELAPILAWTDLSLEERRARVKVMVREITAETREQIETTGRAPLGVKQILRQDPHDAPTHTKSSPKPIVHASSPEVRTARKIEFYVFRRAYREASEALRDGDFDVEFPPGSHRPRLPFFTGKPPPVVG